MATRKMKYIIGISVVFLAVILAGLIMPAIGMPASAEKKRLGWRVFFLKEYMIFLKRMRNKTEMINTEELLAVENAFNTSSFFSFSYNEEFKKIYGILKRPSDVYNVLVLYKNGSMEYFVAEKNIFGESLWVNEKEEFFLFRELGDQSEINKITAAHGGFQGKSILHL